MDWLVLDGVAPWDGRYELDIVGRPLTYREWEWIVTLSGYMPATFMDGFRGADPRLARVLAVVALHRAGRIAPDDAHDFHERFADLPFDGTIRLELGEPDEQEDDAADPPESASRRNGSGHDSTTSSAPSAGLPRPSGIPGSATSASALVGRPT